MLSKESKIRVLENFYGLDYVFFGKPVNKFDSCCPLIKEEYYQLKGSLLSVFIEMLRLVKHSPEKIEGPLNTKKLNEMAIESAKKARLNSKKIVMTEQSKALIKERVKSYITENKEVNIDKVSESKIREMAYTLAVDNLLVARILGEKGEIGELNSWTGKIIEDSYKIIRDSLCETVMLIKDEDV